MYGTNNVRLIGNFGQTPKKHVSQDGKLIVTFSFATHEKRKDERGEWKDHSEWHNIVAFGKEAQLIEDFMDKGSRAAISGRLQTRQYVDKQNNSRYTTEIILEGILFLGGPAEKQRSTNPEN